MGWKGALARSQFPSFVWCGALGKGTTATQTSVYLLRFDEFTSWEAKLTKVVKYNKTRRYF